MGYLAATAERYGFEVEMVEFRDDPASIIERVLEWQPTVVGFSLIFQYYLPAYPRR